VTPSPTLAPGSTKNSQTNTETGLPCEKKPRDDPVKEK